jgi:hypothetical protein
MDWVALKEKVSMTSREILLLKVAAMVLLLAIFMTSGCTVVSSDDPSWQWPADLEV